MFEEILEDIARKNCLREVNASIKLAAGQGAILPCLLSSRYLPPLLIAIMLSGAILFLARVDVRTYAGLFIVSLWFALMSNTGIIIITAGNDILWQWEIITDISWSVTRESINQGMFVFCRTIGGMSTLCFISLTTPMTDIFVAFRQCRVPEMVIDLMIFICCTIFILIDHVIRIYHAHVMRLGYSWYHESIRPFATLCGAAFITSWDAGDDLIRAMNARRYEGKIALLGENHPVEPDSVMAISVFLFVSAAVVTLSGNITLL